jgi:hypothetical protein
LPDGVSCLVRGAIAGIESRQLAPLAWVSVLRLTFARVPDDWRLCLTDIDPLPPLPRTAQLDIIRSVAHGSPRTIIAGDFNTPLDSVGFDAWRTAYHHGFADCPTWRGPLETWGFGVPLLAIDHIWMSRDLAPVAARKQARFGNDHLWLFVECRRAKPAP